MVGQAMQRPALCRQLGISRQLVSDLLATLEIRGLVHVAGTFDGLPGRSQQSYTLRANAGLALGFELGETELAGKLCDMRGAIVAERAEPTRRHGVEGLVGQIAGMADALCADASLSRLHVRYTAIGVPARLDLQRSDAIRAALNDASLAQPLTAALGGSVFLGDARVLGALEVSRQGMLELMFGAVPPI